MNFHVERFLEETKEISIQLGAEKNAIEKIVQGLIELRANNGRLFVLGVGGGAANASHAVNDFRKLCSIDAVSPVDNVPELTARTNDEGWKTVFDSYLRTSHANQNDAVFVFSVGGGNSEKNISANIVSALLEAKKRGMKVFGVVGRDGGYTAKVGDAVVVIPTVNALRVTPHTEGFQMVILHCLVSHPDLRVHEGKWESVGR